MGVAEVIARLRNLQQQEEENLQNSANAFGSIADYVEEEEVDSESPILDAYHIQGGNRVLKTLINFTLVEFNALWAFVESDVHAAWNMGRGRRPQTTAKDAMFMSLVILKHYDTWDKHAIDFGIKPNTLEKMIYRVLAVIEPVLTEEFIIPVTMTEQRERDRLFHNYPYALYATDVKFQPAYRPSGRFMEQKKYFSGKHKLYGYKLECSVAYPGFAVSVSSHEPGSTSDLTMFLQRQSKHREMLRKGQEELTIEDNGEGSVRHPGTWAVLVDKGYQGAADALRTIQPKRAPRGGQLDHQDVTRNALVSSDRVLVENYFGRMSSLWRIMSATYKWSEDRYDMFARLCVALTNYHVSFMPLRMDDSSHYRAVLARYHSMSNDMRQRRARTQAAYRTRREERLATPTPPRPCHICELMTHRLNFLWSFEISEAGTML